MPDTCLALGAAPGITGACRRYRAQRRARVRDEGVAGSNPATPTNTLAEIPNNPATGSVTDWHVPSWASAEADGKGAPSTRRGRRFNPCNAHHQNPCKIDVLAQQHSTLPGKLPAEQNAKLNTSIRGKSVDSVLYMSA